jgi:hypothetical protein
MQPLGELIVGYYPILDHAPKGRDKGEGASAGSASTTSTTASDVRLGEATHDVAGLEPRRREP